MKNKEYYESLDKRTKEYKEWKAQHIEDNTVGLGDVVETITEATGIKKAVEKLTPEGKDCGCNKRKKSWNKLRFRFKRVRCFTEEQYNQWTEFRNRENKPVMSRQEQIEILIPIFKQLFARQLPVMSCCTKQYVDEIDRVYNNIK